jgi:hypothetical protein
LRGGRRPSPFFLAGIYMQYVLSIQMKKYIAFLITLIFMLNPFLRAAEPGDEEYPEFIRISSEMKDLLDREVLPVRGEKRRLDRIVELIFNRSVVGFDYSSGQTSTAAETFRRRTGNC